MDTPIALALGGLTFMLAVIWGGPLLRVLKHFRIGKLIRVEGPERHITKMGTPTMGGVMIIVPVVMMTILLNAVSLIGLNVLGRSVLLPLVGLVAYAILGAIDDWEGIRGPRRGLGMRARTKFIIQVVIAVGLAFGLRYVLHVPQMYWPGVKADFDLGIFYIPIAVLIIVGMSNAVNFTDGLDGLAGLISATAFAAYGGDRADPGAGLPGALLLHHRRRLVRFPVGSTSTPAELFMGDTGALSLGATLGIVALMTGQWLLLPVIAIIPVSEVISDVLQIGYFKMTKGRRLFKMAPIHHHFELLGWSETQVVQRFWLVGLLCAMLGVALALV